MAIGIMFVLTITVSSVMVYTAASAGHANHSNAGQKAYALAEAGVNDALAVLNANYPDTTHPYPGNWCLLRAQTPPAGFPGTDLTLPACTATTPFTSTPDAARPNETATWWGRIRLVVPHLGPTWVIRSTGSVPNPTGPGAAPVTRTLTVKVPVDHPDGPGRAARRSQLALLDHQRDRAQLSRDQLAVLRAGEPPDRKRRRPSRRRCTSRASTPPAAGADDRRHRAPRQPETSSWRTREGSTSRRPSRSAGG